MSTVLSTLRTLSALVLLAIVAALPSPVRAQDGPTVFERQYELRFLPHTAAQAVAQNQCPPEVEAKECRVAAVSGSVIAVVADAETQRRVAAALAERDVPPSSQAFQITLLRATRTNGGTPRELPSAIAKAMEDVKPFLPYHGYEVLDAAFLRTSEEGFAEMVGPEGRAYTAQLSFTGVPGEAGELFVQRFVLIESVGSLLAPPPPTPAAGGGSETPAPAPRARQTALSTSFSIAPGETVVVGTSRIGGGESALVVLVTALP